MSAPNWETRAYLRELRGRPRHRSCAQRHDPHARSWHGGGRSWLDPRGWDPLEEMRGCRGRKSEYTARRYAELRALALGGPCRIAHFERVRACEQLAAEARAIRESLS